MSNAAGRNRKRDNAEKLGQIQTSLTDWFYGSVRTLDWWIETTPGQVTLFAVIGILTLLASLITP